jgi:vitamin B12 transporter
MRCRLISFRTPNIPSTVIWGFVFNFLFSYAYAEDLSDYLQGKVIDKISHRPIKDVMISSDSTYQYSGVDGEFQIIISNQSFQTTSVEFSKDGYIDYQITINTEDFPPHLRVELYPIIYSGSEVLVKGSRSESDYVSFPIRTYKLAQVQIDNAIHPQHIFKELPGLIVKSYGGPASVTSVSFNGSQGDRLALMLDGIILNSEQNGIADISQIPTALLTNIEFYPQGSSARFGSSALSGVINMVPGKSGSWISHSFGENKFTSDAVNLNWKHRSTDYSISAGIMDYQSNNDNTDNGVDFQNAINQKFLYFKSKYFLDRSSDIDFQLFSVFNKRDLSGFIYLGPNKSRLEDELQTLSMRYQNTKVSALITIKKSKMDYNYPGNPGPPLNSHFDLSVISEKIRYNFENYVFVIQHSREKNNSSNTSYISRDLIFGSVEYSTSIGRINNVNVLRIDHELNTDEILVAAESILQFQPGEYWSRSSLSFSSNFKRPGFNDMYWVPFGNPNLKVERSTNIYFRNIFKITDITLDINTFYVRYRNLIQWLPKETGIVYSPENIDKSESYGYNASFKLIRSPFYSLQINYGYNVHKHRNPEFPYHSGKQGRYSPKHSASVTQNLLLNQFTFTMGYNYVSSQIRFYSYPNDLYIREYSLFNFSITQNSTILKHRINNVLSVDNAFNLKYETIYGYPEPGRNYSLKTIIYFN